MQHIGQMFPALLQHLHHLPTLSTSVWRALWQANVGPAMIAHTSVSRYDNGVLTVRVDHHAWHQQLMRLKGELIETLNQSCGRSALKDLVFVYHQSEPSEPKPPENHLPR